MRKFTVTNLRIKPLIEKLEEAKRALDAAEGELYLERKKCAHRYVPYDEYDPSDKWFSSSCYCEGCGYDGKTWWCPKSPSGLCDYKQGNGYYNMDNCIHCHQPDERK